MADEKSENATLKAEVAALKVMVEQLVAAAPKPVKVLPRDEFGRRIFPQVAPEFRGTKTYVVGPGKHVRNNRTYQAGELITVTDERPAKDWKLAGAADAKAAPAAAAPVPGGRVNDKSVGG